MEMQQTATCYIFDGERFLLHFHKRHQKWLPPGGHLEDGETAVDAVRREVLEEVGLTIEFLSKDPIAILVHDTRDSIFLARAVGGTLTDGKWCTLEEIEEMEVFEDTKELARSIHENWRDRLVELQEGVEEGVRVERA